MNPSRLFILRPVATSLLMFGILLVGIVAYRQLPVSALPEVDYPTIQVMTFYPGADPTVMASSVTAPLERQFGQVPGLSQMTSSSSLGSSVITLQFGLDQNIDIAEQEVQAAINASGTYLPTDLPNPPIYSKVNPADAPILTLAMTSDTLPLSKVEDVADSALAQKISQVSGVGLVSISGGQKPAVRIQANPTALASYGLSLEDMRTALAAANVDQAKGTLDGPRQAFTIDANDQLLSGAQYNPIVIAYKNGAPVRVADVAAVTDSVENEHEAAWMGRGSTLSPAVIVNIQRQPGANIITVVDRIKKLLPMLQHSLPAAVKVSILTDRTQTIRASVTDVEFELSLTIGLVVMVIFLFLRNLRATIIPSVAVPLSLVGTFGVMYLLGYSLNNLTLMALTISTGFVVDDAIVMIENIARFLEAGDSPLDAALKGAGQIGFTIVSLTVSLIAVLIPLLFMGDIVGRLFREFAVTLAVTILVSAFVSLTLTPMMSARLLRSEKAAKHGSFYQWSENLYEGVIAYYGRTLKWVLRHQTETLLVTAGTLVLTIYLYVVVPKGFFPVQDTGVILGISDAPQNISFDAMSERQQQLARVILKDPDVDSLSSFIGVDGTNPTLNSGRIQINLKPRNERTATASEIIRRLQQPLNEQVQGIKLYMQPIQDLTVEDRVSRTQFQYSIEDTDPQELAAWSQRLLEKLRTAPELVDVASDQQNGGLQANLVIDRDTASRLGILPVTIDNTLYDAFGQRQVSTIYTQLNQYHVVLEVGQQFQENPEDLNNLYVKSTTGTQVPLSAFSHVEQANAPLSINHQGQFPVVTLSFNLAPGGSLGQATKAIDAAEQEIGMPASIHTSFQGTAAAFQNSLSSEPLLILAAIVTVYIVLGVLYESYIHPITILSTLPSAGVGALLALLLTGNDLGVVSLIGIILLIGIVKKNAIMMIDFALEAERDEHKEPEEAIYQASLLRFRPIMMTTMAALLAGLPLALGRGTGSELRHPLGVTIVGGLLLSQLLTLYTTPVVYLWFDRLSRRFERFGFRHFAEQPASGDWRVSVSSPFIKRPVGTSLLTIGVLLAGILAFRFLPVAPLPQVEFPVIQVQAGLPGASPETMASAVATPLERQFGRIAGVNQMTSSSQMGSTSIVLQFDLTRNIDAAGRDVQAAINAARSQLPTDMPGNPTYRKANPADAPILILALTSDTITVPEMYDAADSVLSQKLSQVSGVGQAFVGGSARPAVRAEVNPNLLNKLGVGLDAVRTALGAANANRPKGSVANAARSWAIEDNDQIKTADKYRPLIVAYKNGAPVRLGDVANVQDSVENDQVLGLAAHYSTDPNAVGKPAVLIIIFKQPGANIIDTVDNVYALLPELKSSISPAINVDVVMDRTTTIRASVHDIEITLLISVVLVILVVFAFLRTVRATVIPSIAVPLSLIGTFAVMYAFGYSLDNLSLMALAISTGFVVDDAIVVLENVTRYLEQGMTPVAAAFRGAREIGFTVLSMSTSLVAVFIPILMMGGIVGRLFREFAVTLSAAIGVSLLVSLSTTPMMCAQILKPLQVERHGLVYRFFEGMFDLALRIYRRSLTFVFRYQLATLYVFFMTVGLSGYLYWRVPKGFFPQQDTGRVMGSVQADQDISFAAMKEKMEQYLKIVMHDKNVQTVVGFAGGNTAKNQGRMFITLQPRGQARKATADDAIREMRRKLAAVPGASLFMQSAQDISIGGRMGNAQYQYTLQGADLRELNTWAPQLLQRLRKLPELSQVNTDQQDRGLEAEVTIDRDTASRLGVSPQDIDSALYDAFGQRQVSTIYRQLNQYHVVMEVDPQYQMTPDALQSVYVHSSSGQMIPLSAIARFGPSNTLLAVNHQGQFPATTISFNLAPNVSLGQATQAIDGAVREIGLPASLHASFQGTAAAYQEAEAGELVLILTALLTVYIVLGILYESFIHPITILSTLPSAGVGALLALLLTHNELNVMGMIGIILLIGIVKKNAIMMIDFALDAERREGKSPKDAIFEACMLRFRPIMMTTMAALLGGLPLAVGTGIGSELRQPLGITIVGGLILSQALTLFTTPVVYLYMDRLRWFLIGRQRVPAEVSPAGSHAD